MKPTSFLNANGERLSPEKVWNPENNSIELDIEIFKKIKMKLISEKINSTESNYFDENLNFIDEFSQISNLPGDKKYKFSIKGNPSVGKIKTLTLGLKNPSSIIGKRPVFNARSSRGNSVVSPGPKIALGRKVTARNGVEELRCACDTSFSAISFVRI